MNRDTEHRDGDDLKLDRLNFLAAGHRAAAQRPAVQLICCAANDLAGDHLANLSRGARSAVLSQFGIAIGDDWMRRKDLLMSSAVTASAAAFNSQMGAKSIRLGPAVAFLMSALNLRLGLWEHHPRHREKFETRFPGGRRFFEMFNVTQAGGESRKVHLSDGGHFENLGLYELIRRHCRYIILSDAGRDPKVEFEDFGNAVRRIRDDFGVDIDIDLGPLYPQDKGESRQHVAVGTIRYDSSANDDDIGILLYFKPSLTGDEPCDIVNYRALNPAFPHESTGDQFYDEAQWESYRRLGEHSAFAAFSFRDGKGAVKSRAEAAEVFTRARDTWYASTVKLRESLVAFSPRFGEIESELAKEEHRQLFTEIYHELATRETLTVEARVGAARISFSVLTAMTRLIEEFHLAADLPRNFNHPQVIPWLNRLQRWTAAPTFRIAWPLLAPLLSHEARSFAFDRLKLPRVGNADLQLRLREVNVTELDATALEALALMDAVARTPRAGVHHSLLAFELVTLTTSGPVVYQVGLSRVWWRIAEKIAEWDDDEFIIYVGYWGAGLGGRFLSALRRRLITDDCWTAQVCLTRKAPRQDSARDLGHRRERNDLVMFYTRAGFVALPDMEPDRVVLRYPADGHASTRARD